MDPELYANVQRTKRLFGKVARELEPGVCLFEGVELFLWCLDGWNIYICINEYLFMIYSSDILLLACLQWLWGWAAQRYASQGQVAVQACAGSAIELRGIWSNMKQKGVQGLRGLSSWGMGLFQRCCRGLGSLPGDWSLEGCSGPIYDEAFGPGSNIERVPPWDSVQHALNSSHKGLWTLWTFANFGSMVH